MIEKLGMIFIFAKNFLLVETDFQKTQILHGKKGQNEPKNTQIEI